MNGEIGITSEGLGKGSTFWFNLTFEKQSERAAPQPAAPAILRGLRVLVVDDNATNRAVLTRMVRSFGCREASAPGGAEALESLRTAYRENDPFRLVLLDMQMPDMDGAQTTQAIKANPFLSDAAIIVLTSMGHRGDASRMEALGCAGYLLKPVKQQQLFDAILAVLGQAAAPASQQPQIITRHSISEQKRQNFHILLAEDNPINQKLAVTLLQKAGYPVDVAENGLQAVEMATRKHYQLIFMDVQMPEMDGFEAVQRIREVEGTAAHTPIIAMTAHAMKGDRERCLAAGMDEYVSKPLDPQEVFARIEQWVLAGEVGREALPAAQPAQADKALSAETDFWELNPALDFGDTALEAFSEADLFFEEETAVPATPAAAQEVSLFPAAPAFTLPPWLHGEQPVNLASALPRFNYDLEFYAEMFKEFFERLPDRLSEMRAALQAGDAQAIYRHAHNLKGVSANFGAEKLTALALRMETQGRKGDVSETASLIVSMEAEVPALDGFLHRLVAQN
jgi:CheY-like chemotaxis protein/HPt (histidine-containing phosphotransfer) domain-containing protein